MRNTNTFRDYIVDQLATVPRLGLRAMFGGLGLYSGEVFFGILAADVLYFKVDDSNRAEYVRAGMSPFKPYAEGPMSKSYYTVPLTVIEDSETLCAWAKKAVAVARRAKK
jgi:DNA transformation protein